MALRSLLQNSHANFIHDSRIKLAVDEFKR
jgi:hypothetical protein